MNNLGTIIAIIILIFTFFAILSKMLTSTKKKIKDIHKEIKKINSVFDEVGENETEVKSKSSIEDDENHFETVHSQEIASFFKEVIEKIKKIKIQTYNFDLIKISKKVMVPLMNYMVFYITYSISLEKFSENLDKKLNEDEKKLFNDLYDLGGNKFKKLKNIMKEELNQHEIVKKSDELVKSIKQIVEGDYSEDIKKYIQNEQKDGFRFVYNLIRDKMKNLDNNLESCFEEIKKVIKKSKNDYCSKLFKESDEKIFSKYKIFVEEFIFVSNNLNSLISEIENMKNVQKKNVNESYKIKINNCKTYNEKTFYFYDKKFCKMLSKFISEISIKNNKDFSTKGKKFKELMDVIYDKLDNSFNNFKKESEERKNISKFMTTIIKNVKKESKDSTFIRSILSEKTKILREKLSHFEKLVMHDFIKILPDIKEAKNQNTFLTDTNKYENKINELNKKSNDLMQELIKSQNEFGDKINKLWNNNKYNRDKRDYYKIFNKILNASTKPNLKEIDKNTPAKTINEYYKILAKEFHVDRKQYEQDKKIKDDEISEFFNISDVLKDEQLKREYDDLKKMLDPRKIFKGL